MEQMVEEKDDSGTKGEESSKAESIHPDIVKGENLATDDPETCVKDTGEPSTTTSAAILQENIVYLKGPRLHLTISSLCMCLFLTNLEIPIVTTSIIGITDDLGSFNKSSWIISAYLLGYADILIVFSKLSDIFGRKPLLLLAVFFFVVFSAACGGAQTMNQLIIFRAFQGVGGAGNYALCSIMFLELVPPAKYAGLTSLGSLVYCLSLLIGPIIGGAINDSSTWRWVFLLNIPPGLVAALVIIVCVPTGFPYHGQDATRKRKFSDLFSAQTLNRVDFIGTGILTIATLAFVAAFEEAGSSFPWRSAFVITLLIVSGLLWIAFVVWERSISLTHGTVREPTFPWRLFCSRVWIGMLLNALFLGGPWFCAIFQLPQRYQFVNGLSPLNAGIRLMPFTFAAPVGSVISAMVAGKIKLPPIYIVIFASILQVIGFVLLSTLPASSRLDHAQYGYEIIAGFGCGVNISLLLLMTPFTVEPRDKAVGMGSVAQFRVMGGAITLAIVTTAFNGSVRSRLSHTITDAQINNLLSSALAVESFAPEMQATIKYTFAVGYNLQMKILAGFAAAQIPSSFLMWQKKQIRV